MQTVISPRGNGYPPSLLTECLFSETTDRVVYLKPCLLYDNWPSFCSAFGDMFVSSTVKGRFQFVEVSDYTVVRTVRRRVLCMRICPYAEDSFTERISNGLCVGTT